MKRILLKHVGNMGDAIFLIPPVVKGLKKQDPTCQITLVTAWGYKDSKGLWGKRNQGGHEIHLLMTNPNIDQIVHFHSTKTSLTEDFCYEEGKTFPTWSEEYYKKQKNSKNFDVVYELDIGLKITDDPLKKLFKITNLPASTSTDYEIFISSGDKKIAQAIMEDTPRPRIVLLEGLSGSSTRSWDKAKIPALRRSIVEQYGVEPIIFGASYIPEYLGQPLTLRQNIATLAHCDVAIGVLSGPLHFAAAVKLPTLTLYCDQPLHRAAPSYFLNNYLQDGAIKHHTLLGPSPDEFEFLKYDNAIPSLTDQELKSQKFVTWNKPGKQSSKSCIAVISVNEIMVALSDMLPAKNFSSAEINKPI